MKDEQRKIWIIKNDKTGSILGVTFDVQKAIEILTKNSGNKNVYHVNEYKMQCTYDETTLTAINFAITETN